MLVTASPSFQTQLGTSGARSPTLLQAWGKVGLRISPAGKSWCGEKFGTSEILKSSPPATATPTERLKKKTPRLWGGQGFKEQVIGRGKVGNLFEKPTFPTQLILTPTFPPACICSFLPVAFIIPLSPCNLASGPGFTFLLAPPWIV